METVKDTVIHTDMEEVTVKVTDMGHTRIHHEQGHRQGKGH